MEIKERVLEYLAQQYVRLEQSQEDRKKEYLVAKLKGDKQAIEKYEIYDIRKHWFKYVQDRIKQLEFVCVDKHDEYMSDYGTFLDYTTFKYTKDLIHTESPLKLATIVITQLLSYIDDSGTSEKWFRHNYIKIMDAIGIINLNLTRRQYNRETLLLSAHDFYNGDLVSFHYNEKARELLRDCRKGELIWFANEIEDWRVEND